MMIATHPQPSAAPARGRRRLSRELLDGEGERWHGVRVEGVSCEWDGRRGGDDDDDDGDDVQARSLH